MCECKCNDKGCREEEHDWKEWVMPGVSLFLLVAGIILEHIKSPFFVNNQWVQPLWYFVAFLPVGLEVVKEAWEGLLNKDFFNEFTLMLIASIGAFCIKEYPEGVAVMLFYCIGEILQDKAVERVKGNINNMLSLKTDTVTVVEGGNQRIIKPEEINSDDEILLRPGERLAVDCVLLSSMAEFDTSTLTGESVPKTIEKGGEVLAGMIPVSNPVRLKARKTYTDSTLSKIIKLVKEAQEKKAEAVKFITRFARIYTPVVILLAALVVGVPAFVALVNPHFYYDLSEWLYRALVFLVISCPCALVISVPLGYFVGIGAASRHGILVKGGNYLDLIRKVRTIVFDKTGTLTTGKLQVKDIVPAGIKEDELLRTMGTIESVSNHPVALTLTRYVRDEGIETSEAENVNEMAGYGVIGTIDGKKVIVGNLRLLSKENIEYPKELDTLASTAIFCSVDGKYAGYVTFADEIKSDAREVVNYLNSQSIKTVILSGDNKAKVEATARELGIESSYGELLPAQKASYLESRIADENGLVGFVGDGLNDAPVLALSDIGIAMGGLGADIALENADVVIQTDQLSKIHELLKIGRITHNIIVENIVMAIVIKVAVLTLGALGLVSLWAAVFADVGVALLAIINSMRIMGRTST